MELIYPEVFLNATTRNPGKRTVHTRFFVQCIWFDNTSKQQRHVLAPLKSSVKCLKKKLTKFTIDKLYVTKLSLAHVAAPRVATALLKQTTQAEARWENSLHVCLI